MIKIIKTIKGHVHNSAWGNEYITCSRHSAWNFPKVSCCWGRAWPWAWAWVKEKGWSELNVPFIEWGPR